MTDNSEIPTKDEIIRNMAKHLQTHMEDGEEVLLRTYDLAFIKGKMEATAEFNEQNKKSSDHFNLTTTVANFFYIQISIKI